MTKNKMRTVGSIVIALILLVSIVFGAQASSTFDSSTQNGAKNIALRHAGIDPEAPGLTFTKAGISYDSWGKSYEIKFYTDEAEYEYTISFRDGIITIDKRTAIQDDKNADKTQLTKRNSISLAQAKSIALGHAGLKAADVTFRKTKLNTKDDKKEYEIEFYNLAAGGFKYIISATTGKISSSEREVSPTTFVKNTLSGNATISSTKAENIALEHAGLKANQVVNSISKKSLKDDTLRVFEIEFKRSDVKYEYVIDAKTGGIISFEKNL